MPLFDHSKIFGENTSVISSLCSLYIHLLTCPPKGLVPPAAPCFRTPSAYVRPQCEKPVLVKLKYSNKEMGHFLLYIANYNLLNYIE